MVHSRRSFSFPASLRWPHSRSAAYDFQLAVCPNRLSGVSGIVSGLYAVLAFAVECRIPLYRL
jgi:hypothetical protein